MARIGARCVACDGALADRPAVRIDEFQLFVCRTCRTWTVVPRPDDAAQCAFHDSDAYYDHPYLAHRRANIAALDQRCASIFARIGAFIDLAKIRGERTLDIGCDTGDFINAAARQFGILPVGLDVARRAVEKARAGGVEAYHCSLEESPSVLKDFPLITAIDLIEHVATPHLFFQTLFERLRPGGVAYVETPNVDSCVYQVGRLLGTLTNGRPASLLHRLFPEEHVQYYSRKGVHSVAQWCGLRVLSEGSRLLPPAEIAVGALMKLGIATLQGFDFLTGEKILRWAILQRPDRTAA